MFIFTLSTDKTHPTSPPPFAHLTAERWPFRARTVFDWRHSSHSSNNLRHHITCNPPFPRPSSPPTPSFPPTPSPPPPHSSLLLVFVPAHGGPGLEEEREYFTDIQTKCTPCCSQAGNAARLHLHFPSTAAGFDWISIEG